MNEEAYARRVSRVGFYVFLRSAVSVFIGASAFRNVYNQGIEELPRFYFAEEGVWRNPRRKFLDFAFRL